MKLHVFILSVSLGWFATVDSDGEFPNDFVFGAGTSAYQIEGAWDEDGKGESIWDRMVHTKPEAISDYSNGDIASDSYHNYKRDVEMMRELRLNVYRFSISWPRLLPSGFANDVNPAGVAFYNNYINEMIKYNITPIVTLHHFDLPQKIQDLGGFMNPYIIDWLEDYARFVFEIFGDRVKYWITFNEPKQFCFAGYSVDYFAPMLNASRTGEYLCARHLLLAHARIYHIYQSYFKPFQNGEVGITILVQWTEPKIDSVDNLGAELYRQIDWGIFSYPIFSQNGGFPKEITNVIDEIDIAQGLTRPSIPDFSDEEKGYIKGTADFFGINYYYVVLVSTTDTVNYFPLKYNDINVTVQILDELAQPPALDWFKTTPKGLYRVLNMIKTRFNNPKIYITENGRRTSTGLEDDERVDYIRMALNDCLEAVEQGVNLKGYMAWTLMDNFEWAMGYSTRLGLYEVDFTSPARTRTPRKSAFVYKQIIKSRVIDYTYEPDITHMTIDDGY